MKFEATPEQQAKLAKLVEFFEGQKDGTELPWLLIESETGVPMDDKGRDMARQALRKTKGHGSYGSVRGEGVILASPTNALGIVNEHGRRVGGAIKRWGKTVENTRQRFLEAMSREDQQQLLGRVAFVGALKTMAAGCSVKQLKAGK